MSPNFPKIKFILRINSHSVNVLLFRSQSVVLLILMGFVLFNLPNCISSRFQYNFWVKPMCGSFFLPTLFPYQMVLVPFNINMMVSLVEQELLTLLSSSPVFKGVHVARYLVFCVVFYKLLFVLLSFFLLTYSI
jgi:hypothetical protein